MQRFRNGNPLRRPKPPPVWASMSHSPEMGHRGDQDKYDTFLKVSKFQNSEKMC